MGFRGFKIEAETPDGRKITLKIEGSVSHEKARQLIDLLELLSSSFQDEGERLPETIYDRVKLLVKKEFLGKWFNAHDLIIAYEETYGEPLGKTTAATYLARLVREGILERAGRRPYIRYRVPLLTKSRLVASSL